VAHVNSGGFAERTLEVNKAVKPANGIYPTPRNCGDDAPEGPPDLGGGRPTSGERHDGTGDDEESARHLGRGNP